MNRYLLVLLITIFLCEGIAVADDKVSIVDEEKEIVQILDILEDFDFLISMELYENFNEIKNTSDTQPIIRDEEDGGKQ